MKEIGEEALKAAKNGDISGLRVAKSKGEVFIEEISSLGELLGPVSI